MQQQFVAVRAGRLVLDRLTIGDVAALLEYKNDQAVARHQAWPMPFTAEAALQLIASTVGHTLASGGQLALRDSSGRLIGDLMVAPVAGVAHAVELGITLAAPFQGQGLASEAVRAVVNELFANAEIHKVEAYVSVANDRSLRLFDRSGFRREGHLRDSYATRDGVLIDEILFGFTRLDLTRAASRYDVVAFDADDTLWHSEDTFFAAEQTFVELVTPFVDAGINVKEALSATERRNMHILGYGVKAFGLSMLECAAMLAPDRLPASVVTRLGEVVRAMLLDPVRLLPDVSSVLEQVGAAHRLVLITKGDLIHQTAKVETSGLAHHFERVEIVMEKDVATYARIINTLGVLPERFCMVGNSLRSDVLPVLTLGGSGVHVPYPLLWELEHAPHDHGHTVVELESLTHLPQWLAQ
jgi:putative hydrolase of the HAD superfamily